MSWSGADLLIAGTDLTALGQFLTADPTQSGPFEQFPAAAQLHPDAGRGWVQLHLTEEAGLELPEDPTALVAGDARTVVAVRYYGVAEVHTLQVAQAGHLTRSLVLSEREVVVDEGQPLDAEQRESSFEDDPEEWLYEVVHALTEVSIFTADEGPWHPVRMR